MVLSCFLAACGGAPSARKSSQGGPPAPVAVDEIVSPRSFGVLGRLLGSTCVSVHGSKITTTPCGQDSAVGGRPLPNADAHVVAKLPLTAAREGDALFVVYPSAELGKCFDVKVTRDLETGRSPLQCSAKGTDCRALCAFVYSPDPSDPRSDLLAGAVSDQATSVRVDFADGASTQLPLTGIRLPDLATRVFMMMVGIHRPRAVEAWSDDHRLARQSL
jgi:hypothetical protein